MVNLDCVRSGSMWNWCGNVAVLSRRESPDLLSWSGLLKMLSCTTGDTILQDHWKLKGFGLIANLCNASDVHDEEDEYSYIYIYAHIRFCNLLPIHTSPKKTTHTLCCRYIITMGITIGIFCKKIFKSNHLQPHPKALSILSISQHPSYKCED